MDPLSMVTSIITLTKTLKSFTELIADYCSADETVARIRSTCELATSVLAYIQEQLDAKDPPALLVKKSSGSSTRTGAVVNLASVLQRNVSQLQLEVSQLVDEVKNLYKPEHPASVIGEWKSGTILVWKKDQLEKKHRSIESKLSQLTLVQTTLQRQAKSDAPNKQSAGSRSKRRSSIVNTALQEQLIIAVRNKRHKETEEILRQTDPNFASDDAEKLHPLHIATSNGDMSMSMLLLDNDAKVDCSHGSPTPLMLALEKGYVSLALALIDRGASVSQADTNRRTPLHIAAMMNQGAVVQVLLDNGANPNARDIDGHTPLFACVNSAERRSVPGDVTVLRVLLGSEIDGKKTSAIFGRYDDHFNPLHLAAKEGYTNDLGILVEAVRSRGLNLDSQLTCDREGRSPLWYAAYKAQVEAIKLLIKFGANVNRRIDHDKKRPTALWAVALSRNTADKPKALFLLLKEGADPNATRNIENQPETLLIAACDSANPSLVKLLLLHGADPRVPDQQGKQPIHYAAINGDQEVVDFLLKCESHPVDINCTDASGDTPLIFAAMNGHDHLIKFLARYQPERANWNLTNNKGSDAFYLACATGQTFCAAYLHGLGADINKPNKNKNTPLHVAARGGHYDTVLWLLRMGADKSAKSPTLSGRMAMPDEVAKAPNIDKGLAESITSLIKHWTTDQVRTQKLRAVRYEGKRLSRG